MHNRILKHIQMLFSTWSHLFKTLKECSLSSGFTLGLCRWPWGQLQGKSVALRLAREA